MNILFFKKTIVIILLLLAIGLSSWSILVSDFRHLSSSLLSTSNQPDAFIEDVTAIMMNKKGLPSIKIKAPAMVHYPENNLTKIKRPEVTIYRDSPQPWYISSEYGEAIGGIDQIIFRDHVVIHHPSDSAHPVTVMKTESLTIFPEKKLAETNQVVTITQPDTKINAIGMLANLNDGTVKLLSQAKGEYVPKS